MTGCVTAIASGHAASGHSSNAPRSGLALAVSSAAHADDPRLGFVYDRARLGLRAVHAVRLPLAFRPKVLALPVRLRIADDTALHDALSKLFPRSDQDS